MLDDTTEFLKECSSTRDQFVLFINAQPWNTIQRTEAESLLVMYDQLRDRVKAAQVKRQRENVTSDDNGIILQPGAWYATSKRKEHWDVEYSIAEVTQDLPFKDLPVLWENDDDSILYWANFDEMFTWSLQNKNVFFRNGAFSRISTLIRKEFQRRNPNNPPPVKYLRNQ